MYQTDNKYLNNTTNAVNGLTFLAVTFDTVHQPIACYSQLITRTAVTDIHNILKINFDELAVDTSLLFI